MLEYFTKEFKEIKDRIKYERNMKIFEGILLILVGGASLFFDSKIGEMTLLFTFPLILIFIALEIFFLADRFKDLDTKHWLILIFEGILFLVLALCFVLNPIEAAQSFIIWAGIIIIVKNILKMLAFPVKLLSEYIIMGIMILVGLFFIFYPKLIVDSLYNIILIVTICYGFIKLAFAMFMNKVIKNI